MALKKLQRILFFLVLVFLPTNLAKHFEVAFAYVSGTLVDYLIPTFYLTDLLLIVLFLIWGFDLFKAGISFERFKAFFKERINLLLFLFLVFATPTMVTVNKWAAWVSFLHLTEGVLFVYYLENKIKLSRDLSRLTFALSLGVLFEGVLATLQWINQGSVLGFLFFGEPVYTVTALGIARVQITGREFVRSYGTFPHPNVLGGYLAIFLPWLLAEHFFGKSPFVRRLFNIAAFSFGLLALLFSFGRVAWVVATFGLGGVLLLYLLRRARPRFVAFLITGILIAEIYFLITGIGKSLSWLLRYELLQISLRMFIENPLFGVGLNNFVVRMGEYGYLPVTYQFLQPVHNIFLLLLSELGIVGFLIFSALFFYVLARVILKRNKSGAYYILISLVQILILGMFDHYLITLQQGRLLFFLVIGLAAGL